METERGNVRGIQGKGYQRGLLKEEEDINNMWEKMTTNIRKVALEV